MEILIRFFWLDVLFVSVLVVGIVGHIIVRLLPKKWRNWIENLGE